MIYKTETGIILDPHKRTLHMLAGNPGSVVFNSELIWKLHQIQPGIVYCLAHTHPPLMPGLSHEDQTTLRAQCQALAPFPVRMATTTQIDEYLFQTTIYLGLYQSKEDWIAKGMQGVREFSVIEEKRNVFFNPLLIPRLEEQEYMELIKKVRGNHFSAWERIITNESYLLEEGR